jgi:hypothetical protein
MSAGTPITLPSKVAASRAPATKSSQITDQGAPARTVRELGEAVSAAAGRQVF